MSNEKLIEILQEINGFEEMLFICVQNCRMSSQFRKY